MKKILLSLTFLLLTAGICIASEDYRWESPAPSIHTKGSFPIPSQKPGSSCENCGSSHPAPASSAATPSSHCETCGEKSLYEIEKERKTLDVLKETPTPMRTPDTILRVLMLPYTDSNNVLHSFYYTFAKVEDGTWVLGDYLKGSTNKPKKMLLHHIDAPLSGSGVQPDKKSEVKNAPSVQRQPTMTVSSPEKDDNESQEAEDK